MIELPLFDTYKPEEIATRPEIDAVELGQVVTICEIKKAYKELGEIIVGYENDNPIVRANKWAYATQESTIDNVVKSRTYTELQFDTDAVDFDFYQDGDEDEIGSKQHWRVIHQFTEKEYYSDNSEDSQNFKIWQLSFHKWQQEIVYKHTNIGDLVWSRPTINVPPINSAAANELAVYSCPTNTPSAPINQTGQSKCIKNVDNDGITTCKRYDSLPLVFSLLFDVGEALGGYLKTDASNSQIISILLKDSNILSPLGQQTGTDVLINNGSEIEPIKYIKRYVQITIDATRELPTYVSLRRYGKEQIRTPLSYSRDLDPELLEHQEATPFILHADNSTTATKYKPPGEYYFPDNFWNDKGMNPLIDYAARVGEAGKIIN